MKMNNRLSVFDLFNNVEGKTLAEVFETEGLYYVVAKAPLYFSPDDTGYVLNPFDMQTFRMDNNAPLGIVKDRYGIVQLEDAFGMVDDLVAEGACIMRAGPVNRGERYYFLLRGRDEIVLPAGQKLVSLISLANSFDRSGSMTAQINVYDTASKAVLTTGAALKIRHTKHVKRRLLYAKKILGRTSETWARFEGFFKEASRFNLTEEQANEYFLAMIPDSEDSKKPANIRERIYKLYKGDGIVSKMPSAHNTLWGAYMAIVEDAEYNRGIRNSKIKSADAAQIHSVLEGNAAMVKTKAYLMAYRMMEAAGNNLERLSA